MIALATAMGNEYELIKKHLKNAHESNDILRGTFEDNDIILFKTGIGKVNAAYGLATLLHSVSDIDSVVSLGCAGAAVVDLSVGDIIIGNSYCYHDVYCGEPNTHGQIQGMPAVFPSNFTSLKGATRYRLGTIATGDYFVTTREKVEEIKNYLPSPYNICAIDMESAALAQVCYKRGIPFTSIRVISDNPLLPNQAKQYKNFWDNMAENAFTALTNLL